MMEMLAFIWLGVFIVLGIMGIDKLRERRRKKIQH